MEKIDKYKILTDYIHELYDAQQNVDNIDSLEERMQHYGRNQVLHALYDKMLKITLNTIE